MNKQSGNKKKERAKKKNLIGQSFQDVLLRKRFFTNQEIAIIFQELVIWESADFLKSVQTPKHLTEITFEVDERGTFKVLSTFRCVLNQCIAFSIMIMRLLYKSQR